MGIPGIFKELGTGERVALSKLAVQHLEQRGRPLRVAIDISIWQFQIQTGQGGKNPALRTLYYRLLKLLSASIQPLFVFDGPYRPAFKRGVKRAPFTSSVDNFLTKQLLRLFGFPFHDAPGEAEAECALLQKQGIVDAVLSEDVDTLMFGSTLCLRNWTAEGAKGNKSPTHVDVYRSARTKEASGLDSEGMILVALMSGGDYIQAGIDSCGIKTACQAARAGFGTELCSIGIGGEEALDTWRRRLQHEIRTNESGYFQKRKKTFEIPKSFPNKKVFGYYTRPTTSPIEKVHRLRQSIEWGKDVDVLNLRRFVEEAFGWTFLIGAKHFIRALAPALLVRKLIRRGTDTATDRETLGTKEALECNLVKTVSQRRNNWVTDGEPELRVAYLPNDVVGLDLETEENAVTAYSSENEEFENAANDSDCESRQRSKSPKKRPMTYDPSSIEKIWVLETFVKFGAPLLVETWEEDMRNPKKFATRKAREREKLAALKGAMQQGAMDRFVKTSKPSMTSEKEALPKHISVTAPSLAPPVATLTALLSHQKRALAVNRRRLGEKTIRGKKQRENHFDILDSQISVCHSVDTVLYDNSVSLKPSYRLKLNGSQPSDTKAQSSYRDEILQSNITPRSKNRQKAKHPGSNSIISTSSAREISAASFSTPQKSLTPRPSPRKKLSPLQEAKNRFPTGQLTTPETTPRKRLQSTLHQYISHSPLTQGVKVNRQLDFRSGSPQRKKVLDVESDSDGLPDPWALLSLPASQPERLPQHEVGKKDSSFADMKGATDRLMVKEKKKKRFVMIRESLEGAWKCLQPEEFEQGRRKGVFEEVEVLNMTGG